MDARTVAIVARAVSEDEATALIEQYGKTIAAEAAMKATEAACDKMLRTIARSTNDPLVQQ